jgi:hypothetical protein
VAMSGCGGAHASDQSKKSIMNRLFGTRTESCHWCLQLASSKASTVSYRCSSSAFRTGKAVL